MNYLLNNYSRHPVEFEKGFGSRLIDTKGNEYLDFLSGIAVTSFGHQHKLITEAAQEQFKKLWHVSNLFESSPQNKLAEKLVKASGLDSVFFCNSGTEANEAAIKFARKWGGERKEIIATLGSFHGRTLGSLSATGQKKLWRGFNPLLKGFRFARFNDINSILKNINQSTCAIMVEPIQGESGVIVPDDKYLIKLRKIADQHNLLLIFDEVQTGMGRTGKMFAHQWFDIKPDLITLAKGIANGLPLGAAICSEKITEIIQPGDHGSTFGANPVAVAAANKVFDLIDDELLEKIIYYGEVLQKSICEFKLPIVKEIRGKGLMIGIELNKPEAKTIVKNLLNKKIIVGNSGDNIIRLLPPFVITEGDVKYFLKEFEEELKSIND